ncbi:glycine--tRNA ligase subunit beta [Sphingomonas koreensis]|uniref:Glycine--tRNA ligase beta subunit n=1 Tax=Sphingomonas koreensis TaxID=93064 RepID=A0A1L6JI73_9SPHN|nr:glycine--tRNA ligase subunit beta [Sphingomonas koreensis]APR55210.1 glycine--tRNA ligase subunit beta [Sphingomonas koreensis]MDC7809486.1 glycine--tRNA ligase subunit beta [Sphingomonas koreensis]RSU20662.1 glycine--tRNA ligase subunit beta [Sphingomonas koreensis]RSU28941.1 glycine--tRNA ligase subunit beta [Sphingomonas koreensis]RSU29846.1 glycine--tRNA ligase subunit beta [Sphingomonas koreensis]
MTDFLLELRSEEIPARMQDKAREDLARLFAAELEKAGLKAGEIVTYATPRRLALIARDLPAQTEAVSEELKGPPADAPDAAIDGFLRKAGLTRDALETRDVKGRATLFAVIDKPGQATAEVLATAIPAIVRAFPWPKSMRWGDASLSTESLRWVRPLQGIVALFGDDVVECEVAGVRSGAATVGHRFHHPGVITIGSASDYVEKLRACHVIVDQNERRATIALGAKMAANKAGLTLIEDEGLLIENAGLTEWPVPLLGRFDEAFLDVPPEVIQLTARVNQKYFVCQDAAGKLANAFVCTANIDAADGGAKIVEGNQKVLAARLSDARFFYDTDLKVPLAEQAKKLEKIVFHEKLGTVADKVERVAKLARWLVEQQIVTLAKAGVSRGSAGQEPQETPAFAGVTELADQAERAARLAKADLVTGMVGEFPELQGLMGGYYAAAQGEDAAVAEAIRDHYKPVGQGDDVPTAPVTVAVSLADKLDTLSSFFLIEEQPTGSRDPFALRRAALGAIRLIVEGKLRLPLGRLIQEAAVYGLIQRTSDDDIASAVAQLQNDASDFGQQADFAAESVGEGLRALAERISSREGYEGFLRGSLQAGDMQALYELETFFADRLKVQQREAGVRHDLIDAVFALGGEDDLVRLLARVHALQAFMGTDDGANLLAGYKRAANILKKEGVTDAVWSAPAYAPEPAEAALIAALDGAEPKAAAAVEGERFEEAMAALATLRAPIDAFFTDVTVNDADPAKRESRLALLARMRDAVHRVADFGKIEG